MASFTLREGLELGSASAATQIEGGNLDHSWMDWHRRGRIIDGTSPARACDHFNRWQEDDQLMADMGLQIARVGVEWARVEPENGVFDQDAIRLLCNGNPMAERAPHQTAGHAAPFYQSHVV